VSPGKHLREGIGCVRDQKTGFTNGTITDHNALDGLHYEIE